MQLTPTSLPLLHRFHSIFTAPTFATSLTIATGWCPSHRHRYVTELIPSAGAVHRGHHGRYHRFLSNAARSLDDLLETLARQSVGTFCPEGTIELGVDDTLCRERGPAIFGTGMHPDPPISGRKRVHVSWGHDRVILSLLVPNPPRSPTEVRAPPVGLRPYKDRQGLTKGKGARSKGKAGKKRPPDPDHRTRPEPAVEPIGGFARLSPRRPIVVGGDSAYGGTSVLRHPPEGVDLIRRVASHAALYEPAPPRRPKPRGPSRKEGDRLPGMAARADDATPWEGLEFDRYGLHAPSKAKTIRGLYSEAGQGRLLTIVLVRDTTGGRPDRMSYRTRTVRDARSIPSRYAARGSVGVMRFNAKQMMGLEGPSNRTKLAVQRAAPVGLVRYGLTLVRFHRDGHGSVSFPDRPWYPGKAEPSYAAILTALRRGSWRGQFAGAEWERGGQETPRARLIEFVSRAA